ncbi:OsmC-like protein [Planctomycetes bacterium Poly30]|uniref:OsmC-like protein n=1 Tax=Saltatorellus ferox TaxID=2528018 RepID=A0A518ETM0_9BACT|nr:OsmC-like protein [Planctomycetes bacterium Poly30]
MATIEIRYEGQLRTQAVHLQSSTELITDAPTDNQGKGESFSPTDLVATALGSCMLTIMGIVAERHGWDLSAATASVNKVMTSEPVRRIARLEVEIRVPGPFEAKVRTALEKAALGCPVHATLGANVDMPVTFRWDEAVG